MAKAIVLTLWGVMPTANRLIAISVCNLLCRKTLQSKISDGFQSTFFVFDSEFIKRMAVWGYGINVTRQT
jgi:hypothetical protein